MPYSNIDWAPMNNMPSTWRPNTQYPPPSNFNGYSQERFKPQSNLLRVTGPESAKAYYLPPNSSVVLFDANEPIFYLKSTDDSGFATVRTFEFSEKAPDVVDVPGKMEALQADAFATKEDLDAIKAQLDGISEALKGLV